MNQARVQTSHFSVSNDLAGDWKAWKISSGRMEEKCIGAVTLEVALAAGDP